MSTQPSAVAAPQVRSPLDELSARHEAMLLRLVSGATPGEVCNEFGFTPSRLSVLRASPLWREAEALLRERIRNDAALRLEALRGGAVEALADTVRPGNVATVRLQSAREILDRTGLMDQTVQRPVIQLYVPPSWQVALAVRVGEVEAPVAGAG